MRRGAPLRVGVVCHFPPPPGGMPGQAETLVCGLNGEGLEAVRIRTNLGPGRLARRLDGIRFLRTILRGPTYLARLLRQAWRVDVLHINTCSGLYFFVFAVPALLLGRVLGRRTVLHYHSGAAQTFLQRWRRSVIASLRLADRVVVPSGFLREVFAREGVDAVVVPNVCELRRFAFQPARPSAPRLIVARHLEKNYNVGCVIRAFAIVRRRWSDATLVVLGGGPQEAELKALALELKVTEAVTFTGYVDNRELPRYLSESTIFVNASDVDNMPISILEAFAAGLPVVSTEAGGIPHLVSHRTSGLLVPLNDHTALAAAVGEVIEDPALAERLARAGRAAAEDFAWERVFPRLMAVYGKARSIRELLIDEC